MSEEKVYSEEGLDIPETPMPGEAPQPWGDTNYVGKPIQRVDGYERLSGTAVYPSDIVLPGMLYGAILRCPHANARVASVDIRAALRMPGVHTAIDASTPEADLGWYHRGPHRPKLFDTNCRYEGEAVAAVAAETPQQARDALEAIVVEYEVLESVSDERDAMKPNAAQVHEEGNQAGDPSIYERGDVVAGFAAADHVLEQSYRTECEFHTPLEPHGCVASWDGQDLTIWESTQGVYAVQGWVANILDMPMSRVKVIGSYVGGGFGSKLQPGKYTIVAALLAGKAARPVKLFLTREETLLVAGNRPGNDMHLKAGVKADGTLTALELAATGTGGSYSNGGTNRVDDLIKDLYTCPNVRTELTNYYINAGNARAMRAPGHPQAAWALEQMMDALAERIGMDPLEMRLKNIPLVSQAREGSPPYSSPGLQECIQQGAATFGWDEARGRTGPTEAGDHIRRGSGMASCLWFFGAGGPPATIVLTLMRDGSVNLNMGASDIGTGTKTIMSQVVAEELGIRPETIQIVNADTGTTQFATPSGGSKTVPTESPAVRDAAIEVKRQLLEWASEDLEVDAAELDYRGATIVSRSDPEKKVDVVAIGKLRRRGQVVGVGQRGPNPDGVAICPFAAHFAEVEVNTRTGEVKLIRFVAAHDSGRVMNEKTYENQVRGGVTMGIGFGMTEARVLDRDNTGKLCNKSWHEYKVPTAMEVPVDLVVLPLDLPDNTANTTGSKGLGEPATIPTAAAIANAVYDAVGVRPLESPINPMKLSALLAAAGGDTPAQEG